MVVRRLSVLLLLVCISGTITAEQSSGDNKIGLALSGGGALGFAHLGVILELEAAGVPVQYIAGTSMGSIVGALYATGYNGSEMLDIAKHIDWNDAFIDSRPRRSLNYEKRRADKNYLIKLGLYPGNDILSSGVSAGQNAVELLDRLMRRYAVAGPFDRFPRPLRIVATNLVTGEEVVFKEGDLKSAIRASMAVPGVFTPLKYRGDLLIDGGWVNVLPVDAVREMGADYVIAVNLNTLSSSKEELDSASAVLTQSSQILRRPRLERNLGQADLVISPDVTDYTKASFEKVLELVDEGRKAARRVLPQLKELAEKADRLSASSPEPDSDKKIHITRINYAGTAPSSEEQTEIMQHLLGETTLSALQDYVSRIYNEGGYEYVSYELKKSAEGNELVMYLVPQETGKAVLRGGYSFRSEPFSDIRPVFVLRSNLTLYDLSGEGSRWSSDLQITDVSSLQIEYIQPLIPSFSALVSMFVLSQPQRFYDDRRVESYYLNRRSGGLIGFRTQLFETMEFTVGGVAEWIDMSLREGKDLGLASGTGGIGITARGVVDNYDRYPFPRRGTETVIDYKYRYQPESGITYNTLSLEQQYYVPLPGEAAFGVGYSASSSLDSEIPEYERSFLGGFGSFSGLHGQELVGRHSAALSTELRIPLFVLPMGVGDKVYAVIKADIGNVWEKELIEVIKGPSIIGGGSLGLSADTLFGEIHLHFSMATGDDPMEGKFRYAAYLVIGNGEYAPFYSAFQ